MQIYKYLETFQILEGFLALYSWKRSI